MNVLIGQRKHAVIWTDGRGNNRALDMTRHFTENEEKNILFSSA